MLRPFRYALLALLIVPGGACIPPSTGVRVFEDPFAGRTRAFDVYLDSGHLTAVSVTHTRSSTKLEVTVVDRSAVRSSVPAGTAVEFRLGDQTLSLPTEAESPPIGSADQDGGGVTQWRLSLAPTREQTERFGAAPLRSFRVEIGGSPRQVTLSEERGRTMQQNMQAVLADE
jgi:hypothetical protein